MEYRGMEYRGMDIENFGSGFTVLMCGDEVFFETMDEAKQGIDEYLDGVWGIGG